MNKSLKKAAGAILMVITLVPYCMAIEEQTSESSSNIFSNILSWLKSTFGTTTDDNVEFENNSSEDMPMMPVINNSENNNTMPETNYPEYNNSTPENITNKTQHTPNDIPGNFNESYVPEQRNMTGMPGNVNNTEYPPQIPENFENNTPIEIS